MAQNPLIEALLNALTTSPENQYTKGVKLSEKYTGGYAVPGGSMSPLPPATPAGDIRPITVSAPVAAPLAPPPVVPTAPTPVQAPKPTPQLDENGQSAFGRFLSAMGIPLAATVAGLSNPNMLAGASGLTTGYNTGRENALTRQAGETFYTYDKGTGKLEKGGRTAKDAKIIQTGDDAPTEFAVQKEARATLNSMLQNNPSLQMQMFSDPNLYARKTEEIARTLRDKVGLTQSETPVKSSDMGGREKAIKFLQDNGKAVTDENINKVIGKI